MNCIKVDQKLTLIKLDQVLKGYRDFISSWLYKDEKITFLVDPGPLSTIEKLRQTLKDIGIVKLDYILLTHIHIDHAGGTGKLVEYFPDTMVLCHPKGIEHMINPEKLWQGSLSVLGDIAKAYGEIIPIPEKNIFFSEKIDKDGISIEVINTPGHAAHHFSFIIGDYLFAGEVAGVNIPLTNMIYTRPATPPRFILEKWLESIDRVIEKNPGIICYGHFGYRKEAVQTLKDAAEQLRLWTDTIREELGKGEDNLDLRVKKLLLEKDKAFSNYRFLDDDLKKREDDFLKNSFKGIKEYILSNR